MDTIPTVLMTNIYLLATNEELVTACLAGDSQAWEALLERYGRLIYSMALKLGLEPEDASDIFQTTCVILLEKLPTLREPGKLHGWLVTTAKRECWRLHRVRGTAGIPLEALPGQGEHLPSAVSPDAQPEDRLLWLEEQHRVRTAFQTLGPKCQKLLWSLYYAPEPLSHADISNLLNVARSSVGRLRARCLERLRTALSRLNL